MQRKTRAVRGIFVLLALTSCFVGGYAFAGNDEDNAPKAKKETDPVIDPDIPVAGETKGHYDAPPSSPPSHPDVPMLDHVVGGPEGGGSKNGTQQKATSNANTSIDLCGRDGNPSTGNPVILATGEKYKIEHDIVGSGTYGMSLDRTYRSFSTVGRMFGTGWSSTYDYPTLQISGCLKNTDYPNQCFPSSVVMVFPDGASYTYTSTATIGEYKVKNSAALGTMSYTPGQSYTVNIGSQWYTYSATTRAIQTITGPSNAVYFTYGGPFANLPTKVSNGAGHYISFTYNSNGLVSIATDQDGNQWQYGYTNVNLLRDGLKTQKQL